jgi:membrane fusion protein, multidrug efflux system
MSTESQKYPVTNRASIKKQIAITTLISLVIILIFGLVKYVKVAKAIEEHSNFQLPPETVTTYKAQTQKWEKNIQTVGTLKPKNGITLSAEVEGKVTSINFESGDFIENGKVIIELDYAVEAANLANIEAWNARAKKAYTRAEALRTKNANSINDLEDAEMQFKQSLAQINALKSTIDKKRIVAPFSGYSGIRKVNIGDYVKAGQELVSLQALDVLYVDLAIPQRYLSEVKKGLKIRLEFDAYPQEAFEAEITAVNPDVDVQSRNFQVQATVNNKHGKLRSGMYTVANIILDKVGEFIIVPSTSINFAPYGDTVYIVEDQNNEAAAEKTGATTEEQQKIKIVRQQIIKYGERRGNMIQILSGIKEGEEIVSSGLFKLRPGAKVIVNNTVKLEDSTNPKPENS